MNNQDVETTSTSSDSTAALLSFKQFMDERVYRGATNTLHLDSQVIEKLLDKFFDEFEAEMNDNTNIKAI